MFHRIKANQHGLSSVIFCDVLTTMSSLKYPAKLTAGSELFESILGFERQLLCPAVRQDAEKLGFLLHESFSEVGASGRTYDRDQVIELLSAENPTKSAGLVADPQCLQLAENLVMLRWATSGERPSQRTSLWVFEENRWQMLFHQGTLSSTELQNSSTATYALRALKSYDADAVYEAFDSNPDMSRQGDASTPATARKYVGALLADRNQCPVAITADDRLIGVVGASIDSGNKNAWVWYWMHAGYRGQSLTTRALASVVSYLFEDLGLHRLELGLRANNPASRLVAEKNGFIREGIEREKFLIDGHRIDVFNYARLLSDPTPQVQHLSWSASIQC